MKSSLLTAILALCLFSSCKKEVTADAVPPVAATTDRVYTLKKAYATAFAKALAASPSLRKLVKTEALKQFDNDYEILHHLIKNEILDDGSTVRDRLLQYYDDKSMLDETERTQPLLTILVPSLPLESFSAERWNITADIPKVAVNMPGSNDVLLVNDKGKEEIISSCNTPMFPVVVIKNNERLVSLKDDGGQSAKGSLITSKDNISFRFLADCFDQRKNNNNGGARIVKTLDPKVVDAYNIYSTADGWHRDYIYYGITPTTPTGQFSYDFQEHLTSFSMYGDATAAYNKISDQDGDPRINPTSCTSNWTGGNYEFKVRVLINAKNGVGSELVTYFSAQPSQLFILTYQTIIGSFCQLQTIQLAAMSVNLPLFNWDLNQYASSIKVEIEEVDIPTTTTTTDTRTVQFATNFGIEATIFKKIGLKFGASATITQTSTITKSITQGNDELGEVIINFADNVITSRQRLAFLGYYWFTRDYSTGYYNISVEPVRVQ